MSPRLPRALCWLVAAMMLALGAPEASAFTGFGRRAVETVYVPSSASILLEPTAFYVPTTFVDYTPTVYATTSFLPTSYYVRPTSFIRPTTFYTPTRYVVRRPVLASSSIVERAYYLPTTTTLDLPVVRTSSSIVCCEDTLGSVGTVISDEPVYEIPPEVSTNDIPPPQTSGSSAAQPLPAEEPGLDEEVIRSTPRGTTTPRPTDSPPPAASPAPAAGTGSPSSLVEPDLPAQPAPEGPEANPPLPPPADEVLPAPGVIDDTQQRTALRPTYDRPLGEARSVLLGKVVSAVTGDPEEGVLVTLADRSGRFVARTATTDADGSFSVVLPEGDWAVAVPDPTDQGGETTIDRYITVSGGVITDDQNRQVTMLTINR